MKETFGKWFLDVAKYILTAMFLTSVFVDMERDDMLLYTLSAFLLCIGIGYVLLKHSQEEKDKKEKRRNKNKNRK